MTSTAQRSRLAHLQTVTRQHELAGGATRAAPTRRAIRPHGTRADGALEVVLREWDLLLGGEERRAEGRVADVAPDIL